MDRFLHELCGLPTAPFNETAVLDYVRRWAKQRRLRVTSDAAGNLLLERPSRGRRPRMVMVAHADHPGFVAVKMTGRRELRARFHGGVRSSFFVGSRVRFYTPDGEVRGTVVSVEEETSGRPAAATIRVSGDVAAGSVGMWDVAGPRVRGQKFHSRVCDDLAGLSAGLAALDLAENSHAAVLVTRGEEEGFIGAIAAAKAATLLRPTDRVISIECSPELPHVRQGDGAVVRVGDRLSVFNSAFTRFLTKRAEALAAEDPAFQFQRALMPGGACEGTVFDAFGYTAAAVCVPLGNYHNMNAATGKIAAEYIDLRDWRGLVRLLADVCLHHGDFTGDHGELRRTLEQRYADWAKFL